MIPRTPIRRALADPDLLGNILAGDSWRLWRILLIAALGEHLGTEERAIFQQITGREHEANKRVDELIGVVGRRGGKSRAIATLACYLAGLCKHPALVPGEIGVVLIIAPDQRQATICLDYIVAAFEQSPILKQLIHNRTADALELTNNISIEMRASNFRRLRGPTYIAVICDEAAFWMAEDSANPDAEIVNAVRPGLATTDGMLVMISSPYARRGELWSIYNKYFGPNGDPAILVAQGASRLFNPSLPQSVVDRAMERDPAHAQAEYLAQFRTDIESFVALEAVRACISNGILERAPSPGLGYSGFVDPSGGSSDSFTLCISHYDYARQVVVIDALRETRPPFSPETVAREFSSLLKSYGISRISGDRYAGAWPTEQFANMGVTYEQSAKPKSDLYIDLLPLINSGRIELLDHPRLISQLTSLERRTARSGRDSIDHAPGSHDDIANAVAGAASINNRYNGYDITHSYVDGVGVDADHAGAEAWRRMRLQAYLFSGGRIVL